MTKELDLRPVDFDPFLRHGELERTAPATEGQTEMWTSLVMSPDANLAYNESISVHLSGPLDLERLKRAADCLVATHDALRISFSPMGRTLHVSTKHNGPVVEHDLSQMSPELREKTWADLRRAATATPFVLDQAPLLRIAYVVLSNDDCRLILSAHHLVTDGWSMAIILTDLAKAYSDGRLDPAPSFADYALQEKQSVHHEVKARDYWSRLYADGGSILEMPHVGQRPAMRGFRALRADKEIPQAIVKGLKNVSRLYRTSYVAVQLAAFAVLLGRLCQQDDIAIGMPSAGQSSSGQERLVGHCVHLLPMRIQLRAGESFASLVGRVKSDLLDAYEHQNFTFGELLKTLRLERDPSRIPLVPVIFNVDVKLEPSQVLFNGRPASYESNPRFAENFEMFINLTESSRETMIECQYNTGLFDADRIALILDAYLRLLEGLAAHPERAYETLSIASIEDEPLTSWNRTEAAYDKSMSVVELLASHFENCPDLRALEAEDRSLSYRELWIESGKLKDQLLAQGIARGDRVGICLDRTSRMVITQIGILRAAGCYVPLDPSYPKDRLDYMIEDAAMKLVVCEHSTRHLVKDGQDLLCWEDQRAVPEAKDPDVKGSDYAYIIYTSGSTGRPKGVLLQHQTVVNFIVQMKAHMHYPQKSRLLAVTTLSFDMEVFEIFVPLVSEGTIVLAGEDTRKDGFLLQKVLTEKHIDVMQATPSTWRMLLSLDWRPDARLTVISGGEAFSPYLQKGLCPSAKEVWNCYGPTEITVYATGVKVKTEDSLITIGRPIGNTRIFILDKNRKPVPPGIKGEVYIGGDGLAPGYWKRPELTAEKFVPSIEGSGRMYQTGDVGRFTSNGEIEVLGRADAQIKLRGYRIELGEIETCILNAPGIRASTVMLREDTPGFPQIVAYIVWQAEAQGRTDDLRRHLSDRLPDYMVPQTFIVLDAMPLLPNGKIDRKALPSVLDQPIDEAEGESSAWDGDTAKLAELWSQALRRTHIQPRDDFFLLGGHSLLAIQMLARVNKTLGSQLNLRDIFQYSKFQDFAAHVLKQSAVQVETIPPAADNRLSVAQERMWYVEQLDPGPVHNLPGGWLLRGTFSIEAWNKALNALREQHDIFSLAIVLESGIPVRGRAEGVAFDCPLVDVSRHSDPKAVAIAEWERISMLPVALDKPSLVAFAVYKIADDQHIAFIRSHHIIWDGWCFDLFWTHMGTFYSLAVKGELGPQKALTPNYADYCSWQRRRTDDQGESYRYWLKQYETIPEHLDLPTDRPRPPKREGEGSGLVVPFSREENDLFEKQAKDQGSTPFMLAMAVLVLTLHRLTGQTDIVIGTPVRGRTRSEFESLFGLFINVLALRFKVDPEQDFASLLAHVRKVCLDGFAHQDLPFESLLSALNPPRDESRTPLYTATFSYQDVSDRVVTLPGLQIEQVHVQAHSTPNDLVFWMKKSLNKTELGVDYRTRLWDRESIVSMVDVFQHLQAQSAQTPAKSLKDFDIFPAPQQSRVIPATTTAWQGPSSEDLATALFDAMRNHPKAIIRSAHSSFTYDQILRKASGVAVHLQKLGVKRGDRVGLCTDRSIELLEGLIGILLAGAAYVPFDPSAPRDRLKVMAEQADLVAFVTQEDWLDILPLDGDRFVIVAEASEHEPIERPRVSGRDPAYVIFTSGSTGTPKAVQISHGAAIHFLEGIQKHLQLTSASIGLALTTVTFDISVLEIFGLLLQGATLVLAESAYAADGEGLSRLIEEERIDFIQMTPSGWRVLLDSGWPGRADVQAITGGEALPRDLMEKLLPKVGRLWNAYGPTEATVWATLSLIQGGEDAITIGRPLPGYETFILNEGRLAPIGVWGELFLGGPGLADGYLKDPKKTSDRFVSHPLAAQGRLYATGDIARLRSDGRLEFKSRADTQVKLRGYRLELEEIETIALRDVRVKGAAAKVWEPKPGDQRLVLYVVTDDPVNLEALHPTLRSFLPKYMWPSHLERLERMPLTPNGKLNRLALPKPDFAVTRAEDRRVREPSSLSEQAIAEIWKDLLGVKLVSVDDNFFDLGGHSLLTLRMLSRINASFARTLKLRDILTANLSQIARLVDQGEER
jgi:amino acid adenylation domain-containing protein